MQPPEELLKAIVARIGKHAICMAADEAIWIAATYLVETLTIPGFDLSDLFALGVIALAEKVRHYAGC